MVKSLSKSIVAALICVSILGPSLVHYIDLNCDEIVFVDFSEEDAEKKTKKEKQDKELILETFEAPNSNFLSELNSFQYYYEMALSSLSEDIVSPPPEFQA